MNPATSAATIKSFVITVSFIFLFVVAVLLDLQYLYIMAVTIALLPLASYGLAWQLAARYAATRTHAQTAPEGRRLSVRIEVAARGGLPQAVIRLADVLPGPLRRVPAAHAAPESPEGDEFRAPDFWDGSTGHLTYRIEPQVRGVYSIGPTRLEMTDPLGLFTFGADIGAPTELVVHPVAIGVRDARAGGEGSFGWRERDGTLRRGEGMEFHAVREYRPGDPLRRVHWRTSARTGRLAVVDYERAYQQNLVIALDLTRGSEYGEGRDTTLEYAIKVAATLTERTLAAGGGVTLITQNDRIAVQPRQGDLVVMRFRLFDILARARADSDQSLVEALRSARFEAGTQYAILTSTGDPALVGYLSDRILHGDQVRVYFIEPRSFGGPQVTSPAVPKGELCLIEREHSPWEEGGRRLEYLLRET